MLPNIILLFAIPLAAVPPGGEEATGTVAGMITFILVALGFSFFCSILEAILFSTTYSHTKALKQEGRRSGALMEKHKENVEDPISAILTLNTIAHTVGAAGAGAQAVGVFGNEFVGIISAVLTLLILVFSEIIPKTLGAIYWKRLTPFAAYSIQALVIVFYPAVWTFRLMTRLLEPKEKQPTGSRVELEILASILGAEGTIEADELRVLRNLLRLNTVYVREIMTPRTVITALQSDMTVSEVVADKTMLPYSRIPIYNDTLDDIEAFVLRHEIYATSANDEHSTKLRELARPMKAVPHVATVTAVLSEFIDEGEHMLLVIGEHGGTEGIVTMEDAVESLLGIEIVDESDVVEDLRELARQRYQRRRALFNMPGINAQAESIAAPKLDGGTTLPNTN